MSTKQTKHVQNIREHSSRSRQSVYVGGVHTKTAIWRLTEGGRGEEKWGKKGREEEEGGKERGDGGTVCVCVLSLIHI